MSTFVQLTNTQPLIFNDSKRGETMVEWVRDTEIVAGFPSGRLFLDSVEQAMAVTLVNGHAARHRHTYSTLLRVNRADIKVMQELLRHASSRVTMDTYTQAVTAQKRKAQIE